MPPRSLQPYWMLLLACLAQNVATGLTFGSIGLLIEPLALELRSSRSMISLAIALVLLIAGLLSPLVGRWVDRWSLRGTMLIGATLSAAGFYLAGQSASTVIFLLSYGLLVGTGFAMMGVLPANKIASLWFPQHFGRAGAIANLPLAIALLPPLFAYVLRDLGWRHLLEIFALIDVALFALLLTLRVPAHTQSAAPEQAEDSAAAPPPFRTRIFWLLSLAVGLVTSSGIVASTHVVPYAQSVGIAIPQAAMLVSMLGIFSVLGAVFYGWFCDRVTPFAALVVIAISSALLWLLLAAQNHFATIAVVVAGLGFGGGGLMPALGAMLARVFPTFQFGSALGQMSFATLPFTFAAAPLIGFCYDRLGNYRNAFVIEAALCGAALLLLIIGRVVVNPARAATATPQMVR